MALPSDSIVSDKLGRGINVAALEAAIAAAPVTVRGQVSVVGAVEGGTGFSVTVMGTGDRRINFDTAFATIPACVATSRVAGIGAALVSPSTTTCRVRTFDTSGVLADAAFHFICMGV